MRLTLWMPFAGLLGCVGALLAPNGWTFGIAAALLIPTVLVAVHHAEVIAHALGEPFGTLVLALAVTVIEVGLVLSVMLGGGDAAATVARDTIFAAVMIIGSGVIGLSLFVGGLRHGEQVFRIEGAGAGFSALTVLATLVMVLPVLTTSAPSGEYTSAQLLFVAAGSLAIWVLFVFFQTVRHRDYFLPLAAIHDDAPSADAAGHRSLWRDSTLLVVSLAAVIGLAKGLTPAIEGAVDGLGAPIAVVGIVIAMIVLLPETISALRAARANRLQTSMNLAIGSALASIGLTVPIVVTVAVILDLPMVLGLSPANIGLLALTLLVGTISLGSGRTNLMQGGVHLLLFCAFLFLSFAP